MYSTSCSPGVLSERLLHLGPPGRVALAGSVSRRPKVYLKFLFNALSSYLTNQSRSNNLTLYHWLCTGQSDRLDINLHMLHTFPIYIIIYYIEASKNDLIINLTASMFYIYSRSKFGHESELPDS